MSDLLRPFENLVTDGAGANLAAIDPARSALIVIDMQNWDSHPDYGLARVVREQGIPCEGYWERVEQQVVPNHVRLLDAFRSAGAKIVFTVPGSYFADYSDGNPNTLRLWEATGALNGTPECAIRSELSPRLGEAVIVKNSSGAWSSSGIDHALRHTGIRHLFFTGVVTNGCVMLSALGAWDHGYEIHVVEDATATFTEHMHRTALEVFSMYNFGLWSTGEVVARFR